MQSNDQIASAGVLDAKYRTLADTSVEDWENTFAVNSCGAFCVAVRQPRDWFQDPGFVFRTFQILAQELKGHGIKANCLSPGPVATDMYFAGITEEDIKRTAEKTLMGRIGETGDIAPVGWLSVYRCSCMDSWPGYKGHWGYYFLIISLLSCGKGDHSEFGSNIRLLFNFFD
ncbi:hypothetical protein LUZ60_000491 [Juncus effusus]|nr:hypothetical protein LUZ60_000491 [Juncus effusus]